jgi:8-oxo-dGTP diphosphatase
VREVREETGLEVLDPGRLLCLSSSVDPETDERATVYVFCVSAWRGDLCPPADPNDPVEEAAFVPLAEAIARLDAHPWPLTREPLVAHLRGEVGPGALWLYRLQAGGLPHRVGVVPAGG